MSFESSFLRLAPPAIFRSLSNLSSSCVAGNVRFQFPTGLPTVGTMLLRDLWKQVQKLRKSVDITRICAILSTNSN